MSVSLFLFYLLFLVFGIAGNKSDMFDHEEVNEDDARNFAKEINAVFKPTSAATNLGIEDLFEELCGKLLGIKKTETDNTKITLDGKKQTKKKGCCGGGDKDKK